MSRESILFEGLSRQGFFEALCWDDRRAARSALDGYARDPERTVRFVGSILCEVFSELDVDDAYLRPRKGRGRELRAPRISICRIALMYFCELLHESPAFVEALSREVARAGEVSPFNFLVHREENGFSLTRDRTWSAPGFADPNPLPAERKDEYARRSAASEAYWNREWENENRERLWKRDEKRFRAHARDLERRRAAPARAAFWRDAMRLTLVDRLIRLASDPDRLPTHYPLDPRLITAKVLERCGPEVARSLAAKFEGLWGEPWKAARERVLAFLDGRETG